MPTGRGLDATGSDMETNGTHWKTNSCSVSVCFHCFFPQAAKKNYHFRLTRFATFFSQNRVHLLAHISSHRIISVQIDLLLACEDGKIRRVILLRANEATKSIPTLSRL